MNNITPKTLHQRFNPEPTAQALLDLTKKYLATLPGNERIKLINHKNQLHLAIPIMDDSPATPIHDDWIEIDD